MAGGIERERVEPEGAEPFADGFVAQVGECEAMAAGVRKRRVDLAQPGEVGVELERMADVDDEQEWRVVVGEAADVVFGLTAYLVVVLPSGSGKVTALSNT